MLKGIATRYKSGTIDQMMFVLHKVFTNSYKKLIINDNQITMIRKLFANRKGPVIFCPNHRSYIDFLVLSCLMYYMGVELPYICAGEDFASMPFVGNFLQEAGAFYMRRTFRGDNLYKAVFYEYVRYLCKDRQVMEFFIEGTRSRTNKMITPKYGFMSVCTRTYFDKDVEDITIIPVTLNYTRTLEGETFPGELRGASKVKESTSRVLSGA